MSSTIAAPADFTSTPSKTRMVTCSYCSQYGIMTKYPAEMFALHLLKGHGIDVDDKEATAETCTVSQEKSR